jgi:alpha-tubulin suppressor-like RCC1 family protein/PKD repeat protein
VFGNGSTGGSPSPVQALIANVTAIKTGYNHVLALKADGTVWAWGVNSSGQLGNGGTSSSSLPVLVSGLNDVIAISAGGNVSMALKSDGTVWAWGTNDSGQAGNGTSGGSNTVPVKSGVNNVIAIAAGFYHCAAVKSDGNVWEWGWMPGATPTQVAGISNVVSVADGSGTYPLTLALKSDGTVWAWGQNDYGQLGNGSTTSSPYVPVQVASLNNVVSIAVGDKTAVAVKGDGTVWTWGSNDWGLLGNGSGDSYSTVAVQVNSLTGVSGISLSSWTALAVKSDGTIWAWGNNWESQLGDGTGNNSSVPVQANISLQAPIKGYYQTTLQSFSNLKNILAMTTSETLPEGVSYLFAPADGAFKKWNGSSWVSTALNQDAEGMSKQVVAGITSQQWKLLVGDNSSLSSGIIMQEVNSTSPTVSAITLSMANLQPVTISGPTSLGVGDQGTFTATATTDTGTIAYKFTFPDGSTATTNPATFTFNQPGQKTVSVEASLVEAPHIKTSAQTTVTATYPAPTITSVTCTTSLYINQIGSCSITAQSTAGTLRYAWSGSGATFSDTSSEMNTATVRFSMEGTKTVTAKVYLAEDTLSEAIADVSITVKPINITASISCPTSLWKRQAGTCTATGTADYGTTTFTWGQSGGGTLTPNGSAASISFDSTGTKTVTATVNVTEAPGIHKSVSANIEVQGLTPPQITIDGPYSVVLGRDAVYTANVICPTGQTCSVTWDIDGEVFIGATASKNFATLGSKGVKATVEINGFETDPDGIKSKSMLTSVTTPPKPLISAYVPSFAFKGDTIELWGNVVQDYDLPVTSYWTLPDGSKRYVQSFSYPLAATGDLQFTYSAYLQNYPEAINLITKVVKAQEYIFPDFVVKSMSGESGISPYAISATASTTTTVPFACLSTLTYHWDMGDGTTYDKKSVAHIYTSPGTYPVTLTVTNHREETKTATKTFTAIQPGPISIDDIRVSKSNRYGKAPLFIFARPIISGKHPRDRITAFEWKVNEAIVGSTEYLRYNFEQPGTYAIEIAVDTQNNAGNTRSFDFFVAENQPPVCAITFQDYPQYGYTKIGTTCKDPDGYVKLIEWDFGTGATSNMTMNYVRYKNSGTYHVVLKATDESGASSFFEENVSVERP